MVTGVLLQASQLTSFSWPAGAWPQLRSAVSHTQLPTSGPCSTVCSIVAGSELVDCKPCVIRSQVWLCRAVLRSRLPLGLRKLPRATRRRAPTQALPQQCCCGLALRHCYHLHHRWHRHDAGGCSSGPATALQPPQHVCTTHTCPAHVLHVSLDCPGLCKARLR